jgi:hypothetical protein
MCSCAALWRCICISRAIYALDSPLSKKKKIRK